MSAVEQARISDFCDLGLRSHEPSRSRRLSCPSARRSGYSHLRWVPEIPEGAEN